MSVVPGSEKSNIVSNDHGRTQKCDFCVQFVKQILQTITHLVQRKVLEIRFWSVKCMTLTLRYAKISSISIPSHQAMQAVAMINS